MQAFIYVKTSSQTSENQQHPNDTKLYYIQEHSSNSTVTHLEYAHRHAVLVYM